MRQYGTDPALPLFSGCRFTSRRSPSARSLRAHIRSSPTNARCIVGLDGWTAPSVTHTTMMHRGNGAEDDIALRVFAPRICTSAIADSRWPSRLSPLHFPCSLFDTSLLPFLRNQVLRPAQAKGPAAVACFRRSNDHVGHRTARLSGGGSAHAKAWSARHGQGNAVSEKLLGAR